ncbi:MAG: hypothetical protein QF381_04120 [Nitrososphaerales archaeon]|nr:hypothetical protein [Nitrososphaerales archaeon]
MVISQTPLRISFFGGGTDLEDFWSKENGTTLSSSIDKFVYVIIKRRFDDAIYLNYSKKEIVKSVYDIQHDLIREAMLMAGVSSGVEITTLADIPSEGSGLGSSSSITVGLLNALYAYNNEQVTAECLASEACNIEIEILEKPIGKQDQYIAAYGGLREITFISDGTASIESLKISQSRKRMMGSNLLLFYTGLTRESSFILSDQKNNMVKNHIILKEMKGQVSELRALLESEEDFDHMGQMLHQAWNLKRKLSKKITNSIIDNMYTQALESGAMGGKICGAGGGGFLLLYVPRESQNQVRKTMQDYREFPFMLNDGGSKIIFNTGSDYWL